MTQSTYYVVFARTDTGYYDPGMYWNGSSLVGDAREAKYYKTRRGAEKACNRLASATRNIMRVQVKEIGV